MARRQSEWGRSIRARAGAPNRPQAKAQASHWHRHRHPHRHRHRHRLRWLGHGRLPVRDGQPRGVPGCRCVKDPNPKPRRHSDRPLPFGAWPSSPTDDMREAPSRVVLQELARSGARLQAYDPVATAEARRVLGTCRIFSSLTARQLRCTVPRPWRSLPSGRSCVLRCE